MYAKITNGQVDQFPYTVGQLRRDNPNTSFPKIVNDVMLAEHGVVAVVVKTAPAYNDRTQKISQNEQPNSENGSWVLGWTVSNKTQAEIDAADATRAEMVRNQRNARLTASDWTQAADSPVDKAAWAAYRQALRDVPQQSGFPHNVQWPNKPE